MAKNSEPQPAPVSGEQPARRVRSPRFVFLLCAVAALLGTFILGLGWMLFIAAGLVITATILLARQKRPETFYAAGTGVAAGTLLYVLIGFLA